MDTVSIISFFISFIIGITIHESAHAWMGNRLGDPTAKDLGRISLNPIRHIDPIGSILVPLIALFSPLQSLIGWAKPTPYNPKNLKNEKKDELLIALAGPISNLLLAALVTISIYMIMLISFLLLGTEPEALLDFLYIIVVGNLILAFFNLLPIPPLDGSTFLKIVTPKRFSYQLAWWNQFGFMIILMASFTPLGNFISAYIDSCVGFCLKIFGFV